MYLSLLLGIIRWPQVILFIGLGILFVVLMKIPDAVRDLLKAKGTYKDAQLEEQHKREKE